MRFFVFSIFRNRSSRTLDLAFEFTASIEVVTELDEVLSKCGICNTLLINHSISTLP